MEFVGYAERAADLVNAALESDRELHDLVARRPWLAERMTPRDLKALRRVAETIRPLFGETDVATVVDSLNSLLRRYPVSPYISGHDQQDLHMHVAERDSSVTATLAAEGLMGMAVVVCDLGPDRFGECAADGCDRVFVDTSPNRSRRYCSDRCSSRANVAAYRARRRAADDGPAAK